MKERIRVLFVPVGFPAEARTIPNQLNVVQQYVGGRIECVGLGEKVILVCNEEGKVDGLAPNRKVEDDIIHGDFFICSEDEEGEFDDLPEEKLKEIQKRLNAPWLHPNTQTPR